MKYALFLQDLENISRDDAALLLKEVTDGKYQAISRDSPDLVRVQGDVEALITNNHRVDAAEVLQRWPNLKTISLAFTGYDGVDLAYWRERGLKLYNVPDYSSDSVAELTIGLTLAVMRKIPQADDNTRTGLWDSGVTPGIELHGKRVGIIGTGTIGTRSAKLFQSFGCIVVGWARTPRRSFVDLGLGYESLEQVLSESDVVVLHLPLTDNTRHIIGSRQLRLMKPTAVLINTARSELIDSDALVTALTEKLIAGAALDVSDDEPGTSPDALLRLQNVVLTPHVGFKTNEALQRLADEAIRNVGRFLAGSTVNLL
jgi:phosphoglycerate dehydrogenase-like enzyme